MRATRVPAHGRIEVADFAVPTVAEAGDLVVQMRWASICGSDVHNVFDGFLKPAGVGKPGYPGHEGVGVVVESRSPRFGPGDAVLTVPVVGGCFAEYQLIDDAHVVALPPDGDLARLVMAQQYGTTLFALRRFWSGEGRGTVAIQGAGSAGLFFLQQARLLGFDRCVISDLNPRRLEVARSLGADLTVHAPTESLIDAVHDVTSGVGADLVIEAVGTDALRADAITAVRVNGTVGYFGFPERFGMAEFPLYAAYRKSARIQLVAGAQAEPGLRAFHDAVADIHSGRIAVDYCLGATRTLEQVPEALASARDRGHDAVKISVDLTGG